METASAATGDDNKTITPRSEMLEAIARRSYWPV
jgi:hypothetical protein